MTNMLFITRLKRAVTLLALALTLSLALPQATYAQCPMCRATAETNLANGGSAGKGLNAGILYMLATPYLIVGAIAFIWWRNRRKEEDESPAS